MTEGGIDAAVVHERLRVIRELLDDLDGIGNLSAANLTTNRVQRHAVERIITQVVDLAVAINSHIAAVELSRGPATYRSSFEEAARAGALPADLADRLAPGAGLRNVLTHEYVAIDLERVAAAIPLVRAGFREYLAAIARYVARQEADDPAM
jgi:uncharacterized protein YutE (UPF0331/DUF86 family)